MRISVYQQVCRQLAGCLLGAACLGACLSAYAATPLDRYVAAPDNHYRYEVLRVLKGDGYSAAIVDMTSQSWLTTNEVDRPVWKHWLTLVRPEKVRHRTGLLFIGGGSNRKGPPDKVNDMFARIALATGTVVAELRMVPNQPLVFVGDGEERVEDSLIAYTWDKFLRTGDERWPARLPMTKSAVRAMDTVTAVSAELWGSDEAVESFVVAGGSKRGWTTWTTAAVDSRVKAIVPIVIDVLNIEPSFIHHWEAYGFYAPAVDDYEKMGIMKWQGTRQYRRLMEIVEPYEYRDRYTMPKLILNATGDQFFLPDSSQFYFDDLPGEKYLRYVPNTDHSLDDSDAVESLTSFYHSVLNGTERPGVKWQREDGRTLRVEVEETPAEVRLWEAVNPDARDFRLETVGKIWKSAVLTGESPNRYLARVDVPARGWKAFFVELTYALEGNPAPFKCTTSVYVVPDRLPFNFDTGQ